MTDALHFDGRNDYLALGDLGVFEDKDGGFITWLYLPDVEGDHVLFSEYDSAGPCHVTLTVKDATLEAVAHDGTNTTTLTGGTLSADTGNHVALAADGTDLLLYLDGALVDSDTLPALALTLDTTVLGRNEGGTDYLFGALSQARCYDSGPTAAEVLADYEAGDWPPDTDPVEERPLFDGDLAITVGGEDVTAAAMLARFTTTSPGGFGEASFKLPSTSPYSAYSLSVVRDAAVVIEHGAQTLFEGTVSNDLSVATVAEGEAFYSVAAVGKWFDASQRRDGLLAKCDADLDQWEASTRGGRALFEADTDGRLMLAANSDQAYKVGASAYLNYWLHKGLGDPEQSIDHLLFVLGDYGDGNNRGLDLALAGNWRVSVQRGDSPFDPDISADVIYTPAQVAAGTVYRVPATAGTSLTEPARAVRFRLYHVDASANTPTADRYLCVRECYVMFDSDYSSVSTITGEYPATVTTAAAHGLKPGDRVFLYSTGVAACEGVWTVLTVPTTTTFTIDCDAGAGAATGSCERLPSPVDAMLEIGAGIGGGTATAADDSYAAALPGSVMVRPHRDWAAAMDDLAKQFAEPQAWGWWESGNYEQASIPTPAAATSDYTVDASTPGVLYDVHGNDEFQPDYVRVLHKLGPVIGLGAMRLSVTYTPSGGGAQVTVDCPLVDDGRLRSADDAYATACAGGAAVDIADAGDEYMYAGQYKASKTPLYRLHESFLDFDVTAVPDTATVNAVALSGMCRYKNTSGDTFTLRAYAYDWGGGTPTSTDWRTPAQLAALGNVAGRGSNAIVEGERFEFTDVSLAAAVTAVLAGNHLRLVLASNEYESASAPTGAEYLALWTEEADVGQHPLEGQVVQIVVAAAGAAEEDPGFAIDGKRVQLLDLSDRVLTTADAQAAGEQYLSWLGRGAYKGTITLKTPTVPLTAGGTYPTPYIRAGEWIEEANVGVPHYITLTDYDIDSSVMTLTVGQDPGEFKAPEGRAE